MDDELSKVLQDYVAAANSGKYSSWEEVNSKFPELKGYEPTLLQDYVTTANSGKYGSWDEVNAKFPEFSKKEQEVSSQDSEPTSEISSEQQSTSVEPSLVKLSSEEEKSFRDWYSKVSAHKNLDTNPDNPNHHYDYRAFYKAEPGLAEGLLTDAPGAHFTDIGKLPGHPTFSNESAYFNDENKMQAGRWDGEIYIPYDPNRPVINTDTGEEMPDYDRNKSYEPVVGNKRSYEKYTKRATYADVPEQLEATGGVNLGGGIRGISSVDPETGEVYNTLPEVEVTANIPFVQNMKNTWANVKTQLEGFDDRLSLVAADTWENILGKELAQTWYRNVGDRDLDEVRRETYEELQRLEAAIQPVSSIGGSVSRGDLAGAAAGVINAVSQLGTTMIIAIPTGNVGIYTDMVGQALYDFNKEKAAKLGVTIDELYNEGKAEFGLPATLGVLGGALERLGFKGATSAMTSMLRSNIGKALIKAGIGTQEEGLTELLQHGLEKMNTTLADPNKNLDDGLQSFVSAITSEEGFEAYLMGVAGAGAAVATAGIGRKLIGKGNKEKATSAVTTLSAIDGDLANPNLTPSARAVLEDSRVTATQQLSQAITDDVSLEDNISPEVRNELEGRLNDLEAIQEAINDPNVSEGTKQSLQQQAKELSDEIDNLINTVDDTESTGGLQGSEQQGETVEQGVQDQEGSAEEVEAGGSIQAPEQEVSALQGSFNRLTEGMTEEEIAADPDLVRMQEAVVRERETAADTANDAANDAVSEGITKGVQQTEGFSTTEQTEINEQADLEVDQEQVGELTAELESEGFTAEESTSFLQDITSQQGREARKSAAAERIKAYWDKQKNLGISQQENPEEFAKFLKDVAEYAAVSLIDGSIRTARGLAKAIGVAYDDSIQQAFDQGKAIQQQIAAHTVDLKRTTKQQIGDSTKGGVQGKVTVTNRQALANSFRSQNIGAKSMAQHVKDLANTIKGYLDSQKGRIKGRSVPTSIVNRIANAVAGVTNQTQIERALDIVDKAITNVEFRGKLQDIGNKQRALRRASGNMPADRRNAVAAFSRINPIDLPISMLDGYLDLLERIPNTPRTDDVRGTSNRELQKYIDTANLWHGKRMLEREERANEPATKEAREERQRQRIEEKQEQLMGMGLTEEEVKELMDSDNLLQTLKNLEDKLKSMQPSREEVLRARAAGLLAVIHANKDEIRDTLPTTMAKRYFDEVLANVEAETIPTNKLVQANYLLHNIAVEGSVVGTKFLIADSKAARLIKDGGATLAEGFKRIGRFSNWMFNSKYIGAQGQVKLGSIITNARKYAGEIAAITGFTDYTRGQIRAFHKLKKLADQSENIIKKYKGKWSNPVDKIRMSIYAVTAQYREGWSVEEIADNYQGRWEGIVNSYFRILNDPSSAVRDKYKNLAANLGQLIQIEGGEIKPAALVHVTLDAEGNVATVEPMYTVNEMYDMLPTHYKEYYDFTQKFFQDNKDDFITTREASDNKVLDKDWINYYPLSYTNIERIDNNPSAGSDIDFNDVKKGIASSMTKETSGSGNVRTLEEGQLPKGSIYNFGLLDSFLHDAGEMLYDVNTSLERAVLNNTTDGRRNGVMEAYAETDIGSLAHYRSIVYDKIVNDTTFAGFAFSEREMGRLEKIVRSTTNIVKNIGVAKALGGFMQAAKQVTPLLETVARLKSPKSFYTALTLMRDPRVKAIMEEASVSMRDISRDHFGISQVSKKTYDAELDTWVDKLGKAIEKGENLSQYTSQFSMWLLRHSDVAYANLGWISMYIDKATDGGTKPLDLSTVDNVAFGYAENQNETIMNASDPSMKGAYSKNQYLPMVSPMLGFSINQVNSLVLSFSRMKHAFGQGNLKEGRYFIKEIVANFLNSALFQVIGASARVAGIMATKYAGEAAYEAAKSWIYDDEDDDKMKEERLRQLEAGHESFKEAQEKAITRNLLNSADYFVSDFIFRGLDLADITRYATTSVTEPIYRAVLGDEIVDESEYGKGGAFRRPGFTGTLQTLSEMTGVFGMGINAGLEWADDVGTIKVTQEDFIKATQGIANAEGSEIVYDDYYMTEDGITEFGKPDLAVGSEYLSLAVSTLGMIGLSDQTLNALARNTRSTTKKVLKEMRNSPKSEKQLDGLLKGVLDFSEINIGEGIPYSPAPEEAGWLRANYLNNVADLRTKYPHKKERDLLEDYEGALKKAAKDATIKQFIEANPHLRETTSKPVRKAIEKAARESEIEYKRLKFNEGR